MSITVGAAMKLAVEIVGLLDGLPIGEALEVSALVQKLLSRQQHDIPVRKYTNLDERLLRVGIIEEKA